MKYLKKHYKRRSPPCPGPSRNRPHRSLLSQAPSEPSEGTLRAWSSDGSEPHP